MKHILPLVLVPLFILAPAIAEPPMNVLFIVSDDLNTDLGAYGSERGVTPNLDRLAAEGMKFERAYCQYPVCNPSRNSFLSGMRPNQTGLPDKWEALRELVPDVTTLPQLFRQNGYYTASVGKIFHISNWDPRWPSEDTWRLGDALSWDFRVNCLPANAGETQKPPFPRVGIRYTWPGHDGPIDYGMMSFESDLAQDDGQVTQEAIRQISKVGEQPFFLAVGYRRPHAPFVAPEKYFWPYPLETMELPDPGERSDVTPLAFSVHPPNYGEPEQMLQFKRCYLACVSFLDAQVGRLLQALDEYDLAENTIVVFFSDHGFQLGEHGNWHKFTLFEESARVPLLVRAPGITRPGSSSSRPVELLDLYPTLRELCRLPAPNQALAGQSLAPLLHDPKASVPEKAAVTQVRRNRGDRPPAMGYSLRTPRYRYNEWWAETNTPRLLATELYDHRFDPDEETNQADNPSYRQAREQLSKQLASFRR